MSAPLWTSSEMAEAMRAAVSSALPEAITGLSIDSRTISPGEAYFAIKGDVHDGHDFVAAALNVAGILAGQISVSGLVFSVVGLALLAYILVRRNTVFGSPFFAGEIVVPSRDGTPPGEREAQQRLAECEARIVKLKEGRP